MGQAIAQTAPSSGTYSLSLRVTAEALWGPSILREFETPACAAERPLLGSTATPGATETLIEDQA